MRSPTGRFPVGNDQYTMLEHLRYEPAARLLGPLVHGEVLKVRALLKIQAQRPGFIGEIRAQEFP